MPLYVSLWFYFHWNNSSNWPNDCVQNYQNGSMCHHQSRLSSVVERVAFNHVVVGSIPTDGVGHSCFEIENESWSSYLRKNILENECRGDGCCVRSFSFEASVLHARRRGLERLESTWRISAIWLLSRTWLEISCKQGSMSSHIRLINQLSWPNNQ